MRLDQLWHLSKEIEILKEQIHRAEAQTITDVVVGSEPRFLGSKTMRLSGQALGGGNVEKLTGTYEEDCQEDLQIYDELKDVAEGLGIYAELQPMLTEEQSSLKKKIAILACYLGRVLYYLEYGELPATQAKANECVKPLLSEIIDKVVA